MKLCRHSTFKEGHARSVVRSVVWRAFGILFLACVTYLFTHNWITTTLVTVLHHGIAIFGYYLHERLWLWTDWLRRSKAKPFMRVFTYEFVFGNILLGAISYLVTREWQAMTAITLTYICNKYWMYYAYDKVWNNIKWQTKE